MRREEYVREKASGRRVREQYKKPELKRYGRLEDVVQNGSLGGFDATAFGSATF